MNSMYQSTKRVVKSRLSLLERTDLYILISTMAKLPRHVNNTIDVMISTIEDGGSWVKFQD